MLMPKDIRNMEDQERIGVLMLDGHTEHCAKRQVWGDGECTCVADGFGTLHHTMNPPPEGWNLPVRGLSDVKIGDWHKPTPNGRPRQVSGVAPGRVYYMGGYSVRAEDLHLMTKVEPPIDPRVAALRADIERQAWNLAGCSTYAAGHGLDEGHDAAYALPALNEVRELALKHRAAEAQLKDLRAAISDLFRWAGSRNPCPPYHPTIAGTLARLDDSFAVLHRLERAKRDEAIERTKERNEANEQLDLANILIVEADQLLQGAVRLMQGGVESCDIEEQTKAWRARAGLPARQMPGDSEGVGPPELPRTPDGRINNCLLAWSGSETDPTYGPCQMCNGVCPDRAILLGRVLPPVEKTSW